MATTTTPRLGLKKQAAGDNPGAWEVDLNLGFDDADARLFRFGAANDPNLAEEADYLYQRYLDTPNNLWWHATAVGNPGTWVRDLNILDLLINHPADPIIPLPIFTKTGLQITRVSGTNIAFGQGEVRAGTAANRNLTNGRNTNSAFNKTFVDGGWAAGDGNGGVPLALSPIAAAIDTWHLFMLVGTDESFDFGFDTSITAANLVADTDVQTALTATVHYKRVASLVCTNTPDFPDFFNMGNRIQLATGSHDVDITNPGNSQVLHTLPSVPTGLRVLVQVVFRLDRNAAWHALVGGGDATLGVPSVTNFHMIGTGFSQARHKELCVDLITNTVQQVATRQTASAADSFLDINVISWTDFLQD